MKKIFLLAFLALFMIRAFAQPSTAATAPTASAATVISILGDSYTNVSGTNWRPDWSQGTAMDNLTIDGVSTIEYSNLSYEGVQFTGTVNASLMDSVHLDVWTADCSTLNFFLINTSTSPATQIGVAITPTLSGWNSITIPLSSYSAFIVGNIGQMMFTGNGTIYLQNIYFRQTAGAPLIPTITGFSIPATQTEGTTYTIITPSSNSSGDFTYSSSNTAVATISGNIITAVGAGTTTITVNQAADPSNNFLAGSVSSTLVVPYPVPTNPFTPTDIAANVISLFGNYYTQNSNATGIANGNPVWYQNWGQQTAVTYWNIGGDTTIEYTNLNYQGVQLRNPIDISAMDTLNIDIWTPNLTSLFIDIIGSSGEKDLSYSLTQTGWNHLRIPLINYASAGLSGFIQFKFEAPTSGGVIFIQNVFFVNAVGKPSLSGFTIPSQTIGVNSTYTLNPTTNSTGAITYSSSNTSVATISDNVITIVGAGTSTISAVVAADANYSTATFTTTLTVNYAGPATAAAVPSIASQYVISLWGNAYTNVSGTSWYPNWGQSTQYSTPSIGGKSTIKYTALNYEGVEFASNLDASLMDSLRMDIWTPNATSIQIYLINTFNGVEQPYTVSLTTNGWNNVSIPLAAYNTIDLSKIRQIKIVAVTPGSGAVIYLQNIYFMNVVGKPTITGFSIPTQIFGTSTYTITNPTSNSTGAFTYSSSNTSVATVSGHTITIKGVGTSTITATQASDNNYLSGSVTTILTVAYPGPTTAAAVPSASPSVVTSLWGNTYTNVINTTWNPIWGQNPAVTTTTLTVGGKTTLEYSNLTYEGVQFASAVNVSSRNLLHFDVWTPNCTSFDLYLINTDAGGVNQLVTVTPTTNGWNSINIPLSNFTSQVIGNINQMKIVATTPSSNAVLYFQNIYFANVIPTWTGVVSSDFSNAANWQYGLTPISSNTPLIPAALAREPVLSANTTLAGITLNGTLGLGSNTLTLTGAVSGSGSLSGSTASSLTVAGTVGTLNFTSGANNLQNLTITSGSTTLGNALNVFGTFTPTAGTITTGGNLTLKSTSITNTAVVGVVGGTVSGTVTVERYIPGGLRTFRDLGAEVANAGSIYANWQESGNNANGYGIQITGSQGLTVGTDAVTGMDYSLTGSHSMFTYLGNAWDSVVNTKINDLNPYQGYRVLIRGDRSGSLQQQLQINNAATLRAKGNLITGTVNFSNLTSGVGNYNFVANPYVSPVLWSSVVSASSGINGTYWYNDPTFTNTGTFQGNTVFVAFNNLNGISNTFGSSVVDGYLQPGQAFFVQNTSASPLLKFTEACKAPTQSKSAIFGTNTINRISAGLFKNGKNVDGAVTAFGSNFSTTIGTEDAIKFPNGGENLAFTLGAKDLCINGTVLPTAKDVFPIHIYNLIANTAYSLRIDVSQFTGSGLQAYLQDNVSKTKTLLAGNNTSISFATNSVDAVNYANRYSVVFGASTLSVSDIKLTASVHAGDVQVDWTTIGELNVINYSVQHSVDGVTFTNVSTVIANNSAVYSATDSKAVAGTNYYRIKVSNNDGTINYSNVAIVEVGNTSASIAAYPNPLVGAKLNVSFNNLEAGKYNLAVYNTLGAKVVEKSISFIGGTSVEQLSINSHLSAGTYTLRVSNANGASYQSKVEVK